MANDLDYSDSVAVRVLVGLGSFTAIIVAPLGWFSTAGAALASILSNTSYIDSPIRHGGAFITIFFLVQLGLTVYWFIVEPVNKSFVGDMISPFGFLGAGVTYLLFLLGRHSSLFLHLILPCIIAMSAFWYLASRFGYIKDDRDSTQQPTAPTQAAQPVAQPAAKPVEPDVARTKVPKVTFASIYGNDDLKARLKDAAAAVISARKSGDGAPRNGILLFGEPGNGKTIFAEALAGEMRLPLLQLSYSDVASKWVGEKSARIRSAFEQARKCQPCLLFIDEVDSFLDDREGGGSGVKEDSDVVNALLTLMVDIRDSRVILMAATNHMDRLDGAGIREGRFDFKVEITPPDAMARVGLLNQGVSKNLKGYSVTAEVINTIARRWNGFSVKRILAITEEMPSYLKRSGKTGKVLEYEDFMGALRSVQGRRGANPENVKPLSELVLTPNTRDMLDLIVGRMADPEHTEMYGGTLPTGVLFHGPAGTGKTAACKAIAKELEWAFLPCTGADMARNPAELEKLYRKAKELRPAIIFIDEADELLKNREYSHATEATNKLLTLMDGVTDRVKDVVWIAATNHPEMIDPALLRGGRFSEKVCFETPGPQLLCEYLDDWFGQRSVGLAQGLSLHAVADLIGDQSIANAEAVAQTALNRAVARRDMPPVVTLADFEQARAMVL